MDSADRAVSEENARDFMRAAGKVDFVLLLEKTGLNTKKKEKIVSAKFCKIL